MLEGTEQNDVLQQAAHLCPQISENIQSWQSGGSRQSNRKYDSESSADQGDNISPAEDQDEKI